jgi:hypothetical protein
MKRLRPWLRISHRLNSAFCMSSAAFTSGFYQPRAQVFPEAKNMRFALDDHSDARFLPLRLVWQCPLTMIRQHANVAYRFVASEMVS